MQRRRLITTAAGLRPEAFGPVEWGLLAATALIWGSSFVFIAEGLEAFDPGLIAWGRILLGAVALALFPRSRMPVDRHDWPRIIVLGVFWMALPLMLFPIAQQWIDSSLAGMLNGAMPLFSALVATVLLSRLPRHLQAIGLLIGFAGVVLVVLPGTEGASADLLGIVLVLVATFCYGLAVNLAVPLQQRYGSLPVLFRAQLASLVMLLPFGIAGAAGSQWQASSAIALVALGVLSTGLAFVAMANLVGRAGATRGAVAIYFIPIVAVVLGVVFRDERVAPLSLLGIVLVIAGAWLSSRREAG